MSKSSEVWQKLIVSIMKMNPLRAYLMQQGIFTCGTANVRSPTKYLSSKTFSYICSIILTGIVIDKNLIKRDFLGFSRFQQPRQVIGCLIGRDAQRQCLHLLSLRRSLSRVRRTT